MRPIADIVARSWRADRSRFVAGIVAGALTVLAGVALLGVAGWFIAASALAGVAGIGFSFNFFQPSAAIRLLAIARTGSRYAERLVANWAELQRRIVTVMPREYKRALAEQAKRRSGVTRHDLTATIAVAAQGAEEEAAVRSVRL